MQTSAAVTVALTHIDAWSRHDWDKTKELLAPDVHAWVIERTRAYIQEFLAAIPKGDGKAVEDSMLGKFPGHHARQFLSVFTIPAYFPAKAGPKENR